MIRQGINFGKWIIKALIIILAVIFIPFFIIFQTSKKMSDIVLDKLFN